MRDYKNICQNTLINKQDLIELKKITCLNILNAKASIYIKYKNKQRGKYDSQRIRGLATNSEEW